MEQSNLFLTEEATRILPGIKENADESLFGSQLSFKSCLDWVHDSKGRIFESIEMENDAGEMAEA